MPQDPLTNPPLCATPAEVSPRALALGLKACCARPEGPALMEQAGLLQPVVVGGDSRTLLLVQEWCWSWCNVCTAREHKKA